jgi:putative ABC transport system substrate-binding protein
MTRLVSIVVLVVALLAAPLAAEAQQAGKIARIAFISTTASLESPTTSAFRQGLQELGYVEGQNILIEWRWGGGTTERLPTFAAEVIGLNVDVIVAANDTVGRAAQRLTKTVPIVIAIMSDPVGSGLVATLARPGGNITGLSSQAPDFIGRRLQLLKETIPSVARVALLVDTNDQGYRQSVREAEVAARTLGLQLRSRELSSPGALNEAFAAMKTEAAGAVVMVGGTMFYANREDMAEQALKRRLPMVCGPREFVDAGCLMSYSTSLTERFRRAASFVDKILKGAKPADLPVEQPTKFDLAINLKTAKALGLTIPPAVLARADEIIQ